MRYLLAAALIAAPLSVHAAHAAPGHKPAPMAEDGKKKTAKKAAAASPEDGRKKASKKAIASSDGDKPKPKKASAKADSPARGSKAGARTETADACTGKGASKARAKAKCAARPEREVAAAGKSAKPAARTAVASARPAVRAADPIPAPDAVAGASGDPALPPAPVAAVARASTASLRQGDGIPDQLTPEQRAGYRVVFAAIRGKRWGEAKAQLDAMGDGPLHATALAELYTAKDSPRVDLAPLLDLIGKAPDLAQADQLGRMALGRGASTLPSGPAVHRLTWYDAPPVRQRLHSIRNDNAAIEMAIAAQPFIKADDGASAEALLAQHSADLAPDSLTEWQQKVAWIYYTAGDDTNARRMAALAEAGTGDFAPQADWVQGLSAWRDGDCEAAGAAFQSVAERAADSELRSAGLYWSSRADMACDKPERVQGHLRSAAQYGETFYGLLARQALGIDEKTGADESAYVAQDWQELGHASNVRTAAALMEIGETDLADEALRYQATIEDSRDHLPLTRLAGRLNLPMTQLWLSNHLPAGMQPVTEARYPAPNWTPAGGWRVDKALVFAHTLQESRFNAEVRSAAGAMGLMQVKLGAATDVGRRTGVTYVSSDLTKPSVNMEIGQSYLEQLRDSAQTQGLLPKVIASYNAGPLPVQNWNTEIRDNGDPLLYIESIPYWETRGYVMTVLRNYWMYELQEGRKSPSREALVQGLWPRFPGLPGASAVKIAPPPQAQVRVDSPLSRPALTVDN